MGVPCYGVRSYMLLMIDNFDSFTFNIVRYFREINCAIDVYRNNEISVLEIEELKPTAIIISPGPSRPENAGISLDVIKNFAGKIPLLGICLGHQCIGQAFGSTIIHATHLMHGKTSHIFHDHSPLFSSMSNPFIATRYHSLVIDHKTLPSKLKVIAWTQTSDDQQEEIMGIQHQDWPILGVQFHPESILTETGKTILENFIKFYL